MVHVLVNYELENFLSPVLRNKKGGGACGKVPCIFEFYTYELNTYVIGLSSHLLIHILYTSIQVFNVAALKIENFI